MWQYFLGVILSCVISKVFSQHFRLTNRPLMYKLTGMYDRTRVMCLIDPQSHSCVFFYIFIGNPDRFSSAEPDSMRHMFWDNGPNTIKRFLDQHLDHCPENPICHALDIRNVEFDDENDDEDIVTGMQRQASISPRKNVSRNVRSSKRNSRCTLRIGASYYFG